MVKLSFIKHHKNSEMFKTGQGNLILSLDLRKFLLLKPDISIYSHCKGIRIISQRLQNFSSVPPTIYSLAKRDKEVNLVV